MSRTVSDNQRADETVTVRLPYGTADKVRAATGQPFSSVVRWMVIQLLERHADDGNQKEKQREDVQRSIGTAIDEQNS